MDVERVRKAVRLGGFLEGGEVDAALDRVEDAVTAARAASDAWENDPLASTRPFDALLEALGKLDV